MFVNIYCKRVIGGFRTADLLIWTLMFPLVLATLFYFAFAELDTAGQFGTIPIAAVEDASYKQNIPFAYALASASEGDDALFDLHIVPDIETADIMLDKGEIYGYFYVSGEPVLVIKENGLYQTIAKSFIDSFLQTVSSYTPGEAGVYMDYTQNISLTDTPPSNVVGYYYALLAMLCLFGGFQGLQSVVYIQANLSPLGARKTVAPVGRFRLITYDLLGGFTMHYLCILAAIFYIRFVLNISFGANLPAVLAACFAGCLTGVSLGAMVASISRLKESVKDGILISVSLVLSFLSGLMIGGVNYTVAQNAPVVSWLNPAARIADALYCLYYYDTYDKFYINIAVISVMAVIMLCIAAFLLRRKNYDSI